MLNDKIVQGSDFTCFHAGPMEEWAQYRLEPPDVPLPAKGKLFLRNLLGSAGLEMSLNVVPPGKGCHSWGSPRKVSAGLRVTRLVHSRPGTDSPVTNVAAHGADIRYCQPWRQFLVWDGARWAIDDTGAAIRKVKDTQAELYRQVAEELAALAGSTAPDKKDRLAELTRLLQHALKWEDAKRINASLELLRSEPGIAIRPVEMDIDPWTLNVLNGTIDLRTGRLRSHDRAGLLTKLAPVAYDPEAKCPVWERSLKRWTADNGKLVDYLQRAIGYSLTADVSEQVLFFLHGSGSNGKTTFLNTIREVLGDYGCQAVSELLLAKNSEAHPTERADLFGRRFVATVEVDQGKRIAESLMKQLTGGDHVKARRMRQDFFEMRPTWKFFLAANHKPIIRGTDFAVWRRIRSIPFTVTIRESDKDKHLGDKLKAEMPGILGWAVRGCLEWQQQGLANPKVFARDQPRGPYWPLPM